MSTFFAKAVIQNFRIELRPNFCFRLPLQPVDATQAANRSAGVSNPNVCRGRSFSRRIDRKES